MPRAPRNMIDDAYQRLMLADFGGGLNTYVGAIALPNNASPDMLNLIPFPGRLKYRGGSTEYSALSHTADQAYAFYDANDAKRFAVFENGNLVDVTSGSEVVIEAAAYTAGSLIGVVELNGILYWSTADVPLRYWNPALGTSGAVAQTGASPPPASPFLLNYTNAIVALGVKFGASAYQPTVMSWSAINQQAIGMRQTLKLSARSQQMQSFHSA